MDIRGRVQNGVVVLEGGFALPEGTLVTISCPDVPLGKPAKPKRRVELPLVRSEHPGSLMLTAERVAELLDESDVPS